MLKSLDPVFTVFYEVFSLTEASDGFLYSMIAGSQLEDCESAIYGYNYGSIIKIDLDGTDFTVVKKFNPSSEGANPWG